VNHDGESPQRGPSFDVGDEVCRYLDALAGRPEDEITRV
jgi:hypothetical protein